MEKIACSFFFAALLFVSGMNAKPRMLGSSETKAVFDSPASNSTERQIGEIRRDSKSAMSKIKQAQTPFQYSAAILDLCWLHHEVTRHGKFDESTQLQGIRTQLAQVLKSACAEMDVTLRQLERGVDRGRIQRSSYSFIQKEWSRSNSIEGFNLTKWDAMQSRWFAGVTGGPANPLGQLPGNFGPPFTDQELIQLIQTTIQPEFWRPNGGLGEIQYYEPALALVVFGSTQIQDEIQDFLRLLR